MYVLGGRYETVERLLPVKNFCMVELVSIGLVTLVC